MAHLEVERSNTCRGNFGAAQLVFYRDVNVNVQWLLQGARHIVAAAQLVKHSSLKLYVTFDRIFTSNF